MDRARRRVVAVRGNDPRCVQRRVNDGRARIGVGVRRRRGGCRAGVDGAGHVCALDGAGDGEGGRFVVDCRAGAGRGVDEPGFCAGCVAG